MVTEERRERHLGWDACLNVRDVGGYATLDGSETRWRALLRSDSLCRLTTEGQAALVAYGVRTIIDLRSPSELPLQTHPFAAPGEHATAPVYHSLPLFDEGDAAAMAALEQVDETADFYCRILDLFPARVGAIMAAVADAPQGGVLVHCFAGKDRTGITVAMLLELAGVPRETIAADYALSDSYLQPLYDELLAKVEDPAERERQAKQYTALPATILATLAHLDTRYGGVQAYLQRASVTDEQIERIRERLRSSYGCLAYDK